MRTDRDGFGTDWAVHYIGRAKMLIERSTSTRTNKPAPVDRLALAARDAIDLGGERTSSALAEPVEAGANHETVSVRTFFLLEWNMRLHDLLRTISDPAHLPDSNPQITAVVYNSRAVTPGALFVAYRGFHTDGHLYIPQAIERGAAAVVYEDPAWDDRIPVPALRTSNARVALAPLAAAFYDYPGRRMRVVGVTGTDGKTTTTFLTSVALEAGGAVTGLMGTVDFKIAGRMWANNSRQSTPEAPEVQALLRDMVHAGCTYAVVEATSHALSARWNRLAGCAFDVAVLTNVTQEHLDFHGTVEQYRRDKARLFEMLAEFRSADAPHKQRKIAVVNADDPHHRMFLAAAPLYAERLTYAVHADADVRAEDVPFDS
ncbi:MAG: Mur ligase family protein [Roseiflexaceae bacterium]|nr:Mur ligase family protein [Roseiflexaceae bacterium]